MKNLHQQLVDLYAGQELPEEMIHDLEIESQSNPALRQDMRSLRSTVDRLRAEPPIPFSEETHQRILMKLYARGASIQPQAPEPFHLQYQLPISS